MPNISNATVATGTGLSTAGNGGRKLVRLSNGWLVSGVWNSTTTTLSFYVSKNNGETWVRLCYRSLSASYKDVAMVSKGTKVYATILASDSSSLFTIEATTQTDVSINPVLFDSSQSDGNRCSLAINEAGTELHAAWSSKNATYPNSFNIRYAKGVINGDGSVTWGAVEQVSYLNSSANNFRNPSIIVKNGIPSIFVSTSDASLSLILFLTKEYTTQSVWTGGQVNVSWGTKTIFSASSSYPQQNPSSLFVPTAINGLANGRLWVAWQGNDSGDSVLQIRYSYSDDGGVTWSAMQKLTSGTGNKITPSITVNKANEIHIIYERSGVGLESYSYKNNAWEIKNYTNESTANGAPSALYDTGLDFKEPLFVYKGGSKVGFYGTWFTIDVSPASGSLGSKETPTITAYTVTPENGSTVTQIVEKLNGVTLNTYNNPASLSRTLTAPNATWDTLAYFATHTASITVTDSNGVQTVTTYSFDKRLATGASLLEATKANTDAKNRISQKRDALAAQVGLSAGATFDAISAQLASGQALVKRQTGLTNASGQVINSRYYITVPISSIGFVPNSLQVFYFTSNTWVPLASVNRDIEISSGNLTQILQPNNSGIQVLDGVNWYISSTEVRVPIGTSVGAIQTKWIAYG